MHESETASQRLAGFLLATTPLYAAAFAAFRDIRTAVATMWVVAALRTAHTIKTSTKRSK